LFSTAATL